MAHIVATLVAGQPMEKIVIVNSGDAASNLMNITFDTSTHPTKDLALQQIQKLFEFIEGQPYPPNSRS